MNENNTQYNQGETQSNTEQNQYQDNGNGKYNTGTYNYNTPPKTSYPRRRSTVTMIVGAILIILGVSHIVDEFLPWVFDWIDSGLVFAGVAIFVGFVLLIKK
jgi:hypothetical protein